jgi:hypothetical protein
MKLCLRNYAAVMSIEENSVKFRNNELRSLLRYGTACSGSACVPI